MSRKGKKRSKAKYRQQMRPAGPLSAIGQGTSQPAAGAARGVSQARVGGDQALVRSVEMSLGARNQMVKRRGGGFIVHSTDPSIPLDRVPYFTRDLMRLLFVGVAMLVILGAGSLAIPHLVK